MKTKSILKNVVGYLKQVFGEGDGDNNILDEEMAVVPFENAIKSKENIVSIPFVALNGYDSGLGDCAAPIKSHIYGEVEIIINIKQLDKDDRPCFKQFIKRGWN